MNRRSFLGRVLSVLAVGPLAKLLPKAAAEPVEMIPSASEAFDGMEYNWKIMYFQNVIIDNPRRYGVIKAIE